MNSDAPPNTALAASEPPQPLKDDLDESTIALFIEQGRKQWAARLAGQSFLDWLRELAKLAEPDDPAQWLAYCVILNEDCWFDYFSDGMTPAECWAEECSYD